MAKLFAPGVVSTPAAAAPPRRLLDLSHEHSRTRTPQFMGEFDAAHGLAAVARGGGWGQAARWEVIASLGPLLCPRPRPFVASSAARGPRRPSAPKPWSAERRAPEPVRWSWRAGRELFASLVEARDRLLAALGTSAPQPKPPQYAPMGAHIVYRAVRAGAVGRLGARSGSAA